VSCGAIVTSGISIIDRYGTAVTSNDLGGVTLPVDVAEAGDGSLVVVNGTSGLVRFAEFARSTITSPIGNCSGARRAGSGTGVNRSSETRRVSAPAASGVAIEPRTGALLVHRRGWPAIEVFTAAYSYEIPLASLRNVRWVSKGHDLFHRDAGLGVACASCHPEGTDDGHVWNFSKGPRRTQPLDVRLGGTAPFHWNGEFQDFGALVADIFSLRMGAGAQRPEDVAELHGYISRLRPRPALRDPSDEAALRGRPLFEARCSGCHAGPHFTSPASTDIGKGAPTQVPSLLGVGVRAPYMHDGCAPTLSARFDPACGGTAHGELAGLDDAGRADLVAYLESL
jgi:hypothetical protein